MLSEGFPKDIGIVRCFVAMKCLFSIVSYGGNAASQDHINTGFVLVKPTQPIRFLISDFLDENWQSEQGGRIWMLDDVG